MISYRWRTKLGLLRPVPLSCLYQSRLQHHRRSVDNPNNIFGIFELEENNYSQDDQTEFYGLFAPSIPHIYGPKVDLIDWGDKKPNTSTHSDEIILDFEVALPITYPQSTELFKPYIARFVGDNEIEGEFGHWLDAIDGSYCTSTAYNQTGDNPGVDGPVPVRECGTYKPRPIISISYLQDETSLPVNYQKVNCLIQSSPFPFKTLQLGANMATQRQCNEFLKLGLQCVSIFVASGDGGVSGVDGHDCYGDNGTIFNPTMPSTCPFVTSVGATTIPPGASPGDIETCTTSFPSGGGFSNIFTTPAYQRDGVENYFNNHSPSFKSCAVRDGTSPPMTLLASIIALAVLTLICLLLAIVCSLLVGVKLAPMVVVPRWLLLLSLPCSAGSTTSA